MGTWHIEGNGEVSTKNRVPISHIIKGKPNLVANIEITGGSASFCICEASNKDSNESEWKRVTSSKTGDSKTHRTIQLTYDKGDPNKWYWLRQEETTIADYRVNGDWVIS
ncbi:hypothetical protein [Nostoc sp. FACHB-280]|uniref:hypothetical protein n=1 Tax=Nostoc sp. FACHB-280 TaxID=2692839 RepID=UPI00168BAB8E|nr:hypothetical protein [Nostoc sp. FACHB-280]MBD2494310.1 hypothetical protein [Nostoc sp. FACHB-280]